MSLIALLLRIPSHNFIGSSSSQLAEGGSASINMSVWATCLCVVTFDENLGQTLEHQVPNALSEPEARLISFLGLPDSNTCKLVGDTQYTFRVRFDTGFQFGYTYFRQCRDASKSRGYFQKAVVLLSNFPYVRLFSDVVNTIAQAYFESGFAALESSWQDIVQWPVPIEGKLELGLLGATIEYGLEQAGEMDLGNFNFFEVLGHDTCTKLAWGLWEVMLLGEPLLIVADDISLCSKAVLALQSLIVPLKYTGDFRPLLSIFDPDFEAFQTQHNTKRWSPLVIGATNPVILKLFSKWPNMLQLEKNATVRTVKFKLRTRSVDISQLSNKFLAGSSPETQNINHRVLASQLLDMTYSFLHPFEAYYSLNLDLQAPYAEAPSFRRFKESAFLKELSASDAIFPFLKYCSKPKAVALYSHFIQTANFCTWFASQKQRVSSEAFTLMEQAKYNYDLERDLASLDLKSCRDLYRHIEVQLQCEQKRENMAAVLKLKKQLAVLLRHMTGSRVEDLQDVFS